MVELRPKRNRRQIRKRMRTHAKPPGYFQRRLAGVRALPPKHRSNPRRTLQFLSGPNSEVAKFGSVHDQRRELKITPLAESRERNRVRPMELEPSGRPNPVHPQFRLGEHPERFQTGRKTFEQKRRAEHNRQRDRRHRQRHEKPGGIGAMVRLNSVRLPNREPGPRRQQPLQLPMEREHHGSARTQSREENRQQSARLPRQRVRPPARLPASHQIRGLPFDPPR